MFYLLECFLITYDLQFTFWIYHTFNEKYKKYLAVLIKNILDGYYTMYNFAYNINKFQIH